HTGQRSAVAQQKVSGAESAGTENQPITGDRVEWKRARCGLMPFVTRIMQHVPHLVPAARLRREPAYFTAGTHVSTLVTGGRHLGVVEGVLRPVIATDVALAAELAGTAGGAPPGAPRG